MATERRCFIAEITTKRQFFELWEAGMLGNRLRIWRQPGDALCESNKLNTVGFRQIGVSGGGAFETVAYVDIDATALRWRQLGREFVICESAPDHLALLQGEVMRDATGWKGFLAHPVLNGKKMRESMRDDAKHYEGLYVPLLLKNYMTANSWGDLLDVLELYPDAVVELTIYRGCLGILPGRNAIFWEVRNY